MEDWDLLSIHSRTGEIKNKMKENTSKWVFENVWQKEQISTMSKGTRWRNQRESKREPFKVVEKFLIEIKEWTRKQTREKERRKRRER